MANPEHVEILLKGVEIWNKWRNENPLLSNHHIQPDFSALKLSNYSLSGIDLHYANLNDTELDHADLGNANLQVADLSHTNLSNANLAHANLSNANLAYADLRNADLTNANLFHVDLSYANLSSTKLSSANFRAAHLGYADLSYSHLSGMNLRHIDFSQADFSRANLTGADLSHADLSGASLNYSNLSSANLTDTDLSHTTLIGTIFENADVSGCRIFGVSAWDLKTENLTQSNLIITKKHEPEITVDNLEIAQFIYLLLNNAKLRSVIDTLTTKSVLILGRFTEERKAVLDAIREELRKRDYVPILFDFDKPANRNFSETVMTLASLSRFVIVDLSDPNSAPYETLLFAERLRSVPLQGIFCKTAGHENPFPMYADLQSGLSHVLPIFRYDTPEQLMASLEEKVIKPAEDKVEAMRPPKNQAL